MHLLFFAIMVLAFTANLAAQEEQTLFNGNLEKEGFGGPSVKITSI